ncbi:hypothetical protein LO762_20375 [Actinocorallia sp. API 0066]|uniref:hypothetical protein n=1 Tax=Actinocorallia sp. API 0066 TaxID=2896846 RepID=UPI001E5C49F9|nr:hypothetical protein [Actinocorallia sp. API 0066]MCD0451534.1 hypothetical protein [Actinocorallia sp. API 0066]
MTVPLPPAAPDVVAEAVESLTTRLRKKLDAALAQYEAHPRAEQPDGSVTIACGEDTTVTLTPDPTTGVLTTPAAVACTCLLSPRCLHRAALLTLCPLPDPSLNGLGEGDEAEPDAASPAGPSGTSPGGTALQDGPEGHTTAPGGTSDQDGVSGRVTSGSGAAGASSASGGAPGAAVTAPGGAALSVGGFGGAAAQGVQEAGAVRLTARQEKAARGLFEVAAAVLAAGVPAAGAVPQAELLRAAHTARVAGLHRAEAAALRVVRGLRSARARHASHRLADLVGALRELLLTTHLLGAGNADAALVGTARRAYKPGGSLRLHGVFREPVISATGYGGVVTHLLGEDGRWYDLGDVRPGGPARARGAGTAAIALGGGVLDHARLARTGLLVTGTTVSPEGRLGAGRGVRATEIPGSGWNTPGLFGRPLAEAVAERLTTAPGADPEEAEHRARTPLGCDLVIIGPDGDGVRAREVRPDGTEGAVVRLLPALAHPDLGHLENLRALSRRPGLHLRAIVRVDPDRPATLIPLAVAPAPYDAPTLTLPPQWDGHADLGYDRLQGAHFPAHLPPPPEAPPTPDPLTGSPLWRSRRLIELTVSGGRRAAARSLRGDADPSHLRATGFPTAASLALTLTAEADRRPRDPFGRLTDPTPTPFAQAWLTAALHLHTTEHTLISTTWLPTPP